MAARHLKMLTTEEGEHYMGYEEKKGLFIWYVMNSDAFHKLCRLGACLIISAVFLVYKIIDKVLECRREEEYQAKLRICNGTHRHSCAAVIINTRVNQV